uniref:Major facilitator superfamily (MFS) profile domain-containing protein n=1 Tax=Plectus sambesii TaxID=2011161 RepID=A0A914WBI4_9BILA
MGSDGAQDLSLNADKALVQLGVWGRYQLMVFILANVPWVFVSFQMMAMAFVGSTPPFSCLHQGAKLLELNRTKETWDSQCSIVVNNKTVQCGDDGSVFDFDPSFGNNIVTEWNLVCDRKLITQVASSLFFAGVLVGSLVIPSAADRYGRRWVILVSAWAMAVTGAAVSFAPNVSIFGLLRFLAGFSTAGLSLTMWVLACEVMAPTKRSYGVAGQGVFWGIGYCLTGLIAYLLPDWRSFFLVTSLSCLSLISYYWLIPESLHWYIAHGKSKEAWRWIERAAKFNGVKVNQQDCLEDKLASSHLTKRNESIFDLFRCRALLIQTAIMAYLWICNTFVYYGLSLFTTELAGDRYINYILSGAVEIPAYLILNPILNRLGRRNAIAGYHVIAGVALFALLFVPSGASRSHPHSDTDDDSMQYLATGLWLVGKFAISSSFVGIWLFGAEIFPTTVRTTGLGICNIASRTGGILAPFSSSMRLLHPLFVPALFGVCSLVAAAVTLILPETAGVKLADEIADVDYGPVLSKFLSKQPPRRSFDDQSVTSQLVKIHSSDDSQ